MSGKLSTSKLFQNLTHISMTSFQVRYLTIEIKLFVRLQGGFELLSSLLKWINSNFLSFLIQNYCKDINIQSELVILGHVDWLSANQGPVFPDSVGSC
eukprot:sb/3478925/